MTTRMKLVSVLAVAATLTATGLAATSASAKGGSYHPVHGAGSSHNPIVLHKKPPIPGKPTHPPCPAGSTVYNSDTGQCS
jgi:hypothetical protein